VAFNAHELGVLAAVSAEGVAPSNTSEEEKAQAPGDSDATDCLSWNVSSILSAGGAWGSVTSTIVAGEIDDHWSSSWGRGWWVVSGRSSVAGWCSIGRWGCSVCRLIHDY
jgi:hypothetical protein